LRAKELLIEGGHFNIGNHHTDTWVCKDLMITNTKLVKLLCHPLTTQLDVDNVEIDVVVGRANGGLIVAQQIASELSVVRAEIISCLFSERDDSTEILRPTFAKGLEGKKVLVTGVIITTGATIRKVVELVRYNGGEVVGVVAWLRRTLTNQRDLGDPPFVLTLQNCNLQSWPTGHARIRKALRS